MSDRTTHDNPTWKKGDLLPMGFTPIVTLTDTKTGEILKAWDHDPEYPDMSMDKFRVAGPAE